MIKVVNPSERELVIEKGAPVGQMVLVPVQTPAIIEVGLDQIHGVVSNRGGSGGIVTQDRAKNSG